MSNNLMLMKRILSFFLSLLLWNQCVWGSVLSTKESLNLQSAMDYYSKFDQKKHNELKSYLQETGMTKLALDGLKTEADKFIYISGRKKYSFTIGKNGTITVLEGAKKTVLFYNQSVKEVEKILNETFFQTKGVVLNLVFESAHAYVLEGIILTLVALIVFATYASFKRGKIQELLADEDALCAEVSTGSSDATDMEKMKDSYNRLSDAYMEVCVPKDNGKGYSELVCSTKVPKLKKCFKEKIESIQQARVNNSARGAIKPVLRYDSATDKFMTQGLSR